MEGNKFLDIKDYVLAQHLLNSQLNTKWIEMLSGFLPAIFPSMEALLGEDMSYTWTLWQSEWAKDYIFVDPQVLNTHMTHLLRHAFLTGTGERVLRYFGHPIRANGQPHWAVDPELVTRMNPWYDGARIHHWLNNKNLKVYNEHNVLVSSSP